MAVKIADTVRPNNHVDSEHLGTYPVAYAEDIWFEDGTRLSEKTFDGQSIQKTSMPFASATELGNVYQFIGTTGTYEHGCFYECIQTQTSPVEMYKWKLLNVIKNPVIYTETEPTLGQYEDGAVIVYAGEDIYGYKKGHHYQSIVDRQMMVHNISGIGSGGASSFYGKSYKEELSVGDHILNDVGILGGYVTEVGNGTFSWYSLYYEEIQEVTNVTVSSSTTTVTVKDYVDIGGGGSGNDYEEFVGTQAEWDALPQSQKNKYDGKIVNITDDEGGINAVDAVIVGNMSPVTSNAVAQCTGYIDTILIVGEPFDTTYQDGSSSENYQITADGLYKLHIFLFNPTAEKSKNRCLVTRYEDGSAKATLADYNFTGAGAIQMEIYVRVKAGIIGVAHEASGGSVGGRCYFELLKVNESH